MNARTRSGLFWLLLALTALGGCATNPVTGERELMFQGESWDREVGAKQYAPMLQSEGGQYDYDPALSRYVDSVGQRIAQHADLDLPYEFTVLNNSVPNAWALPGGKIAINRGLLTELDSEAELAAVLGHEIVHAAARHGAQQASRGMLLQGAVVATGMAVQGREYGQIASMGTALGAQLISQRYSRDAEREADYYGMQYMAEAGYDPQGAVDLQETFVELSENRNQEWLSGLFASHPPSRERLQRNRELAAELPGGELGRTAYRRKTEHIRAVKPAYEAYEKGVKAASDGRLGEAESLAQRALSIEPEEARFHALRGDIHAARQRFDAAVDAYDEAVRRDPDWFYFPLRRGIVQRLRNRPQAATSDLNRSLELLPTALGHYQLGLVYRDRGNRQQAIQHFEVASEGQGEVAQKAQQELQKMQQ